ncbi:MAG: bifunctional homocysteine S-methyltransferase/methylenetetrahydrofolate reductase [Acidobacteria bacterium]|nr:bifunctional homocysteine S-methyltransferase/methylenetetrahydrofolate reductase [Acidobacteriota bacterium]
MSRLPFLDALASRVLVCDGAMGTMLYGKGVFINRCFESLNVSQPDLVRDVHNEYLAAGADVIETNTFGASRLKLRAFGLGDQVHALNLAGAQLARAAAGDQAYVAGAIGPLGVRIEPWGKTGVDEAREFFREQAAALVEGGVDLLILETFRDWNEAAAAVDAVRSFCTLPIVALVTTEEDGNSLDGTPPEQFGPALLARGANVVGVNCSVGPAPMLETIERLAEACGGAPLSAQPNAGKPRDIEGRNIYLSSPEYMASYARRFIASGVRLVGGCCGTTPEHIRQIAQAVKQLAPDTARAVDGRHRAITVGTPLAQTPVASADKSVVGAKLAAGTFVTGVELAPSRGHAAADALAAARLAAGRGVDLVLVSDAPRGGARVGALALAALIRQQGGIEPLLQYSCRDRNLLGIQSDLLGAHAMGLRNVLGITGDVRKIGDIPDATAVFDVDSVGLTHVLSRLNHGLDIAGQSIGEPTALLAGVMVNPAAADLDRELRRFEFKVEAGAEFVVTRPVFDVAAFERFLRRIEHLKIPVIAGIWPFDSALNAEFMANEVPDVVVPLTLVERMRATTGPDASRQEGAKIAVELVKALRPMTAGVVVSTPAGRVERALEVLAAG